MRLGEAQGTEIFYDHRSHCGRRLNTDPAAPVEK
jgi:hypothetical protein